MSAPLSCPHARFAQLRNDAPVSETAPGVWAVTRHADVQQVLRDPENFSARVSDGNPFAMFGPSPVQDQIDMIMADYPEKPVLMQTDPPDHRRVRNVVARVLTPGEIVKFEPKIHAIVDSLLADWGDAETVEFISAFAMPLPCAVTTDFICGEPQMRERFRFWAGEIMSRVAGPLPGERQLEIARNIAEMGRYFLDRIAARRAHPTGDLISLIANATCEDGQPLEDVAIVNVLETFMVGGNETTTFLLGNSLIKLAEQPALAAKLRAEPALIPAFVEEILRLEPPEQAVVRRTVREVVLGDTHIPADAMVMVHLVSANRDACAFNAPDVLLLERPVSPRHVAFGHGNHSCLGLQLARAEACIALKALLAHMHDIVLMPEGTAWLQNDFLRGPIRLNLCFRPGKQV